MNLTITEEFVKTLLLSETLERVNEQFISQKEKVFLESFDMNFRLFKPTSNYINLELLARGNLGNYYKPIGFFDRSLNVYILHEFEDEFKKLQDRNELPIDAVVRKISLKDNAVIAAFSMDVINQVLLIFKEISEKGFNYESQINYDRSMPPWFRYDKRLVVNGYISELIMTFDAFPQFFLDDEYGLKKPIGSYRQSGNGNLVFDPIVNYKTQFDKLYSMSLLSAYKRI